MAATKIALLVALVAMALSCVAADRFGADSVTSISFNEYHSTNGVQTTVFGPSPALNTVLSFGTGQVYDFGVTINNKEVGRSRGLYIENSISGLYGQDIFTISFQSGDYAGSTLSLAGQWSDKSTQNEVPVTGGTGIFAFASGSASYTDSGSYYKVKVTLKGVVESHGNI